MRLAVLCIAVLTSAMPEIMRAQSLEVDTQTVRACFEGAQSATGSPLCLGDASNACQARPGGSTTIGIVACISSETTAWDGLLNAEYRATRARMRDLGGGRAEALLDAQRAWIAFRDAECTLSYIRWQEGTIRSIVAANCQMVMTARRTIALRDMRENRP